MRVIPMLLAVTFLVMLGPHQTARGQCPKPKCEVPDSTSVDDWELKHANGIPFRIAQLRKYYGETRLLVYVEPKYFDRVNLENVFSVLSKENDTAHSLWVNVFGNRDVLRDEIRARSVGLWSWEDLPDSESHYKKDSL